MKRNFETEPETVDTVASHQVVHSWTCYRSLHRAGSIPKTFISARLALMGFKLRHGDLKYSAAFRTPDTGGIPHHIHHVNPQGGPMCLDTSRKMLQPGVLVLLHRLILAGQMSRQRLKREPMRQMAGATGQNEMLWRDESFDTQAQGMHREALLEKRAAGVDDRHQRSASPARPPSGLRQSVHRHPPHTESHTSRGAFSGVVGLNVPDGEPAAPYR